MDAWKRSRIGPLITESVVTTRNTVHTWVTGNHRHFTFTKLHGCTKKSTGKTRADFSSWLITWSIITAWSAYPHPWGLSRGQAWGLKPPWDFFFTTLHVLFVVKHRWALSQAIVGEFTQKLLKIQERRSWYDFNHDRASNPSKCIH